MTIAKTKDNNYFTAEYSPIYFATRNLYGQGIAIYGAIGLRIYYRCSGKEAAQRYEDEWREQDAENQE